MGVPLAFVEDVGVPPELLPGYLYRVQEVLQRHETTASYLIHAATGQVHMRPFIEWRGPEDGARLRALADEVYELVLDLGGSISAQMKGRLETQLKNARIECWPGRCVRRMAGD